MTLDSVGELEIQHAILELMKDRRVWANAELKQRLADLLPWSDEDRRASTTRPNEFVWENRVNNALSPSRGSSLYAKQHVETGPERGTHRITETGFRFITDDWSPDELLSEFS